MTGDWIDDGHTATLTLTQGRMTTSVQCPHPDIAPGTVPACRTLPADAGEQAPPTAPCLLTATAQVYQDDELWDADEPDHEIGTCPFPVRWRAEKGLNGAELYLAPSPQTDAKTKAEAQRPVPPA